MLTRRKEVMKMRKRNDDGDDEERMEEKDSLLSPFLYLPSNSPSLTPLCSFLNFHPFYHHILQCVKECLCNVRGQTLGRSFPHNLRGEMARLHPSDLEEDFPLRSIFHENTSTHRKTSATRIPLSRSKW